MNILYLQYASYCITHYLVLRHGQRYIAYGQKYGYFIGLSEKAPRAFLLSQTHGLAKIFGIHAN